MARPTRLVLSGETHHVVQRGNNRQAVFFGEDDRELFLSLLGEAAASEGCVIHAYVLMESHFHLVVTAGANDSISRLMQSLGRRYVSYINRKYDRTGTLWEGRYKSTILDGKNYVLACQIYVESNPVRAMLVPKPGDYPWSSYLRNGSGRKDPLIRDHAAYHALGVTPAVRRAEYRELHDRGLTNEQIDTIRDATQRGWVPGSKRFRQKIERALGRRVDPPRRGRPPKELGHG